MVPTANYAMFSLAERLGQSVSQMLTGSQRPMTGMEYWLWNRFSLARARLEHQARRGKR